MPRLLSEYLAARAQSAGRISANADVDVRSVAKIDHTAVLTIRVVAAAVLSGHSQILTPGTAAATPQAFQQSLQALPLRQLQLLAAGYSPADSAFAIPRH